jgi:glutamate/tyrosine decarboxylase-like PLP-dependent enzyme
VVVNIVCFRYNPGSLDTERLNALNEELLIRLLESGVAAPSYTTLNNQYCLRAALSNHRTTLEDLRGAVVEVQEIGRGLRP